jgi:nicotinamidase-related amidase
MADTSVQWKGVGLLLIDIQNDFISGSREYFPSSLHKVDTLRCSSPVAVKDAESILPTVKRLIKDYPFQVIISSQV